MQHVYQITHLICAHCGRDVVLDNSKKCDVLSIIDDKISFTCPCCFVEYDLPCIVRSSNKGSCKLMIAVNTHFAHLSYDVREQLRRIICGESCNGHCKKEVLEGIKCLLD